MGYRFQQLQHKNTESMIKAALNDVGNLGRVHVCRPDDCASPAAASLQTVTGPVGWHCWDLTGWSTEGKQQQVMTLMNGKKNVCTICKAASLSDCTCCNMRSANSSRFRRSSTSNFSASFPSLLSFNCSDSSEFCCLVSSLTLL